VPTYQYACTECGEQLETVQSFSDPALTECPSCSGRLRKVFSAVGVVFKGSGFYRTDSRSGGKKPAATPAAEGSASTAGSDASSAKASSDGKSGRAASSSSSGSSSTGSGTAVRATGSAA
jgi:putative FmdB family regulatory protein